MKATLDFDLKTISLDMPVSLKEMESISKCLVDYEEWTIIAPVMTVSIPSVWATYPPATAQGTLIDAGKITIT